MVFILIVLLCIFQARGKFNQSNDWKFLVNILYPKTKEKLCLFNSSTFKHPQNLGYLSQADINLVLNTFSKLIDITDSYSIEAQICGIENIEVSDSLLENIHNSTKRATLSNCGKSVKPERPSRGAKALYGSREILEVR